MIQTKNPAEKRRFPFRPETRNLIHFTVLGEEGAITMQGMGRTLNISLGGVLLEIHAPVPEGKKVQLSMGMGDDVLDLDAVVAHARPSGKNTIYAGLSFLPMTGPKAKLLSLFIEQFESE
ncbi:PilZ domain-containing protein [Desulfobotulus alkaliphilus]|uniref:PilZ domain-containing protein n=1 Tax=Desulfobotulus alkaliphilus TaxID=622671 RepID=A0A562RZ12_9BACT|nr:PilZ domain-containing protein [Desulfobotulus alkaliphilus]TWI74352.1 PilZ domain-containing protein [Desulfobotulus alkaliphilus]